MSDKSLPCAAIVAGSGRRETLGLAVIFAGIVWFYGYIGLPPAYPVSFTKENPNYYNQLADGFMAGRAGFKIDPPAALVALPDPYEPKLREQAGNLGLHDASYYKGRYYLYFGVAPALVLFLPFKVLTGLHFPMNLATVIFCAGGYLCSLGLLVGLRRCYFSRTGTGYVWVAAMMLGLGNLCPLMLVRNSVWELPISAAYFFSTLGFGLIFMGMTAPGRRTHWLFGASVALGLAVASRPHFVFCAVVLCILWGADWLRRWRRGENKGMAPFVREAVAVMLPMGLILTGLLAYNFVRFENPFEFGQKYQLSGNRQIDSQLVSFRFFPINAYLYLLAPAQLERYFPFFQVIRGYPGIRPADYGGAENPFGILVNLPVSWLAALAPLIWMRRFRRGSGLGTWLMIFGVSFLALAAAVMCFAWSANRYMVDFVPVLLLLALLGILMLSFAERRSPVSRMFVAAGVSGLVAYTLVFNVLITFRHEVFRAHRPGDFAALSGWLDRPVFWWEKFHPVPYGPVDLLVRFPRDKPGRAEPLLVSGVSYLADYLYVYYSPDARHVQLALNHTNHNQLFSQPIPVDYGVPHHIGIVAGALYPMESHPFFSGWPTDKIRSAKHDLQVTLDDVPYLTAGQDFFESSPEFLTFGENRVSDYISRRFTGEILDLKHKPLAPAVRPFMGGSFVRLGLIFPSGKGGRRESIVATGGPGRADIIFVAYEGDERVRLGFQHSGADSLVSAPIGIHPGEIQLLEVSLGSFYPEPSNSRQRELAHLLVVRLNGETVWSEPLPFHPMGTAKPRIGEDLSTTDRTMSAFSGKIVTQQPVELFPVAPDSPFSLPPYWIETGVKPAYGAIRMHLMLPQMTAARIEPLLVSGATAATADYVSVNYSPPKQLSFGFLHAGNSWSQGARTLVDPARTQIVEINLPALYPSESDVFFATRSLMEIAALKKNSVRVKLNGRIVLQSSVQTYEALPAQVTLGVDQLEHAIGANFSGRILAFERECLDPPDGLASETGPLELKFVFPDSPMGKEEDLLATGDGKSMDALMVVYDKSNRVHFEVRTFSGLLLVSSPIAIDSSAHSLRLEWGGLYPAENRPANIPLETWLRLRRSVIATLDGKSLFKGSSDFVWGQSQLLVLGGSSSGAATFSGRLQGVKRLPADRGQTPL